MAGCVCVLFSMSGESSNVRSSNGGRLLGAAAATSTSLVEFLAQNGCLGANRKERRVFGLDTALTNGAARSTRGRGWGLGGNQLYHGQILQRVASIGIPWHCDGVNLVRLEVGTFLCYKQ